MRPEASFLFLPQDIIEENIRIAKEGNEPPQAPEHLVPGSSPHVRIPEKQIELSSIHHSPLPLTRHPTNTALRNHQSNPNGHSNNGSPELSIRNSSEGIISPSITQDAQSASSSSSPPSSYHTPMSSPLHSPLVSSTLLPDSPSNNSSSSKSSNPPSGLSGSNSPKSLPSSNTSQTYSQPPTTTSASNVSPHNNAKHTSPPQTHHPQTKKTGITPPFLSASLLAGTFANIFENVYDNYFPDKIKSKVSYMDSTVRPRVRRVTNSFYFEVIVFLVVLLHSILLATQYPFHFCLLCGSFTVRDTMA